MDDGFEIESNLKEMCSPRHPDRISVSPLSSLESVYMTAPQSPTDSFYSAVSGYMGEFSGSDHRFNSHISLCRTAAGIIKRVVDARQLARDACCDSHSQFQRQWDHSHAPEHVARHMSFRASHPPGCPFYKYKCVHGEFLLACPFRRNTVCDHGSYISYEGCSTCPAPVHGTNTWACI